jgi:hypothetical protein
VWRSVSRNTIGQALEDLRIAETSTWGPDDEVYSRQKAKRDLGMAGFGLFTAQEITAGTVRGQGISVEVALLKYGLQRDALLLAVPNTSSKIAEHLNGTDWQHGAWKDALRQCPVPGVMITHADINKQTIDGTQTRCTLIVLDRYHAAPER